MATFFRVPLAAAKPDAELPEIRISGQASAERSVVPHWPGRRSNHAIIQPHFRRPPVAHGKTLRYSPFCHSGTTAKKHLLSSTIVSLAHRDAVEPVGLDHFADAYS